MTYFVLCAPGAHFDSFFSLYSKSHARVCVWVAQGCTNFPASISMVRWCSLPHSGCHRPWRCAFYMFFMSVFRSCFFYWRGSSVERLVFERLIDISLRHRALLLPFGWFYNVFCYTTTTIIISEKFLMHITLELPLPFVIWLCVYVT